VTIDISARLRQLVLAGLPLVGAACQASGAPPAVRDPLCRPRTITVPLQTVGTETKAIGFDATDSRLADLYQACAANGDYCARLCGEVLALGVSAPAGLAVQGPTACDLGCDSAGQPVARVSYSLFHPGTPGRRPEGFVAAVALDHDVPEVAAFFSASAELEGASIAAFQILADELAHHGAPAALIDRARAAARDEARHFKLTTRLARKFGATTQRCPRIAKPAPRDLLAMALENATEGCVSETFAAGIALHQAATASDPAVRAIMAAIAEDELGHAQLAWDVHAWLAERLDSAGAAAITRARAEAAAALLASAAHPVPTELVTHAGLPDAPAALRMAAAVMPLWA
jgi:hypothetical protein